MMVRSPTKAALESRQGVYLEPEDERGGFYPSVERGQYEGTDEEEVRVLPYSPRRCQC